MSWIQAGIAAAGAVTNVVKNATSTAGEGGPRADVNGVPVHQDVVDAGTWGGLDYDQYGNRTAMGNELYRLNQQKDFANNRRGASMAMGNLIEEQDRQLEARRYQTGHLGTLQAQMRGEGPSLAQLQLQRGLDASNAQAASLAAGARGGGAAQALAQRQAIMQGGQATMNAGQQSAMIRANEQLAAQQQYAAMVNGMRQGDQNAFSNQADVAKYSAQLRDAQMARNDALAQYYENQRRGVRNDGTAQGQWLGNIRQNEIDTAYARNWGQDTGREVAAVRKDENVSHAISSGFSAVGNAMGGGGGGGGGGSAPPPTAGGSGKG